jgi:hypothetical protein
MYSLSAATAVRVVSEASTAAHVGALRFGYSLSVYLLRNISSCLDLDRLSYVSQYGYLTFFAFLYPATPFLVLLVHQLYGALLLQHLSHCRRPHISKRYVPL